MSAKILNAISQSIDDHFGDVAIKFIGLIPSITKQKTIKFTADASSLVSLFFEALGSKKIEQNEEDTLKSLLIIANSYVDALKEKTKASVIQEVSTYINNKRSNIETIKAKEIKNIVDSSMDKARSHFNLIVNAESNRVKNTSKLLKFQKVGASLGVDDPTVAFIPTIDERNDPETYRLHLLPDRITPRVWKLSELGHEYHKKGDKNPKVHGTNPNCRCVLTIIPPGYGYDASGKIKFISFDHDELSSQREKHGMP